jgi:signal transduction histidine kinase
MAEGVNMHTVMTVTDVAQPAESAAEADGRRSRWSADNPLVRAIGRVRLPLGAKLIAGFLAVGALLALVAALGLSALGQSNSRGEQLRQLQQRAVYYQLVLTDATQVKTAIENRIKSPGSETRFGSGLDQSILSTFNQLCVDTGVGDCVNTSATAPQCVNTGVGACAGDSATAAPKVLLTHLLPYGLFEDVSSNVSLFAFVSGASPVSTYESCAAGDTPPCAAPSGYAGNPVGLVLRDAHRFAAHFQSDMARTAAGTRRRANALVAANRHSYSHSRTLLLGVAGGSLALALALALLLSWSVVAPLRRTQERLSGIAGGDFSEHVVVPNRDEIGALAADVNRMNDELRRLYGELETASRHKSDFLATMSHELRTPLNAIIGFSEVLQEQMFGELNERQLAYVNDVLEAGRHLLSLINDVLDLAKIEAGRMELELSQVAIPDLLRSAVSMHSERASRSGIELDLTTEPEQITITADERRVRQIVFNLLSNAVKFTPADGRIDVSARLDHGQVEIAVADTGPGIAAIDLESIFEEFEQTSEGKQAEGTGLGLPLSRKLAELHGGELWAESTPGKGSAFHLTLPARQETAP